jgi:lysophospholipase L1-like esterase
VHRQTLLAILSALGLAVFASAGPVEDQPLPISKAGLVLWLRGGAGVAGEIGSVAKWPDQSGNGNDAVQPTPENQPAIVGKALNHQPVLRFDGVSNLMTVSKPVAMQTVFVVARSATPQFADYNGIIGGDISAPHAGHILDGIVDTTKLANGTSPFTLARRNGAEKPFVQGHDFSPIDQFWIGSFVLAAKQTHAPVIGQVSGGQRFWNGDIAEILVYDRVCTIEECQVVEHYLSHEYAIPLAGNAEVPKGADVAPDNDRIRYRGCASALISGDAASFERPLKEWPYHTDSPNVVIIFRSNAQSVTAWIEYVPKSALPGHDSYNSPGLCWIDGKEVKSFTRPGDAGGRQAVELTPAADGNHDYEIFLPIADKVIFRGLTAGGPSALLPLPPAVPAKRYVAYGDSITQGWAATNATHSYAFLLARARGLDLVNLGFGSRRATDSDGRMIADQRPDVVTVLIGVNDWWHKVPLETFRAQYAGMVAAIRRASPDIPVYLITPLPVVLASWGPIADLEKYRQEIREVVKKSYDAKLFLVEGPDLIPAEEANFQDGLHPNNQGFQIMAARLAERISP